MHILVALIKEAHFLNGIRLKSFHYEMRAIFTDSLVHETLSKTVVYGSNEPHSPVDTDVHLEVAYSCNFLTVSDSPTFPDIGTS